MAAKPCGILVESRGPKPESSISCCFHEASVCCQFDDLGNTDLAGEVGLTAWPETPNVS